MIARIRTVTGADLAAVHALNEGALPHVNRVDESVLDWFRAEATRFVVAEVDGEIRAFMVALAPPTAYWSDNYNWFVERHTGFVYVDRVAVHPDWHGRGLGRALYDDLLAAARRAGDIRAVACEVNLRPPNPGSLAFHRRLGFREVGELDHDGGAKRVAMLMRTV
ncbi:MAG: GNAT family N-acetyltransferase [Ectothiorhodospiraceae bacterium]|nr:GNAT family N-acetyltransferase [Chromatiales bacterium]MCP5157577.1 GNAT family N-acetyltransferase [Ectothiorhodospiraceae bacterium]